MAENRKVVKRAIVYGRMLFCLMALLFSAPSMAQFYSGSQMSFGKNRVQYKDFFWTYYKYENFDVYFYLGGQELALYTAKYVEDHLGEIEDKLDTGLDDKMQFIVFNTLTDLKQSNIGLIQNETYNTGGVTHIMGKKVFIYYDGNHRNFDKQIRAGLAQTIVNQLLFGSSIGSQIKNTSLFPFPDWYMNGLVSYISEEWNADIDGRVKDGILSGRFDKFNQLSGEEATIAGHAFWKYIAEKYGQSSISNIVYMAKVSRRLESGFLYILGVSYKNLVQETLEYYKNQYEKSDEGKELPQETILKRTKDNVVYGRLKISPDGNKSMYTYNRYGKYKVFLQDLNTGKKKKILRAGYRLDEKIDYSYPLVAWHPSGRIMAIYVEKKGEPVMYYYLLDEKKLEKVVLYQFEKVLDFAYSDDGLNLVMSAVFRGQTDIFVYNIGSNSFEQITKDHYDDLNPRFINNSQQIIFSSNRISDTLRLERKYEPTEVQDRYDLFLYNVDNSSNILRRVTKTPLANEIQPMEYEDGYISFLSDENGIYNRYLGRFDSAISYIDTTTHYRYYTNYFPISNYSRNIVEHDISKDGFKFGQVIYKDKTYKLQVYDQLPATSLTGLTLGNTNYQDQLVNLYTKAAEKKSKRDASQQPTGKKRRGFSTVRQSQAIEEYMQADSLNKAQGFDINNYEFDTGGGSEKNVDWKFTNLSVPLPGQKDPDEPPKRLNYDVEYFINEIVSQIDFSYLNQNYQAYTGGTSPIYLNPGFNALFKIGLTDLMEDYRITGGVRLNLNLVNNEYLFSYANLKKRLDKEIIFHRQGIENITPQGYIFRVYSHELYYIAKWPLNQIMAFSGTASYRNDKAVYLSLDVPSLAEPNYFRNWVGGKGEFIYDDTKNLGVNLFHGTRFKVFAEYSQLVDEKGQNLVVLGFDFRNYQKIHRVIVWANRFATSTSFGTNKLIYYMGGVDNWLFPKFNLSTPVDYAQNYAYQTLATNMRGFNQNIRNGNSFAVINSEIRFPVFRYFAKNPIKSDFLNNFQLVGFGDIGTAWTGLHPYSEDNYLFTNKIEQAPLNITVQLQKNPIVGGYGFGARTRLLGYFIRADVAWGVEDGQTLPAIFYLSLSLDF